MERTSSPITATTYRVTRWNANGEFLFKTDIAYEAARIPEWLVDTLVAEYANDLVDVGLTESAATQMVRDSLYVPGRYPPVTEIIFGADGSTWLAREGRIPPPYYARRYQILDERGRPSGTLALPRPGELMAATATAIWVVEMDSNDAQTLVRYQIVKPDRPG